MKTRSFNLFAAALATCVLALSSCSGDKPVTPSEEFAITVTATTGGTATSGHQKAAAGTTITLSAIPNTGFRFDKWTVDAGDVTPSGNPATFTMPSAAVSVKAEFVNATEPVTAADLVGSISGTKTLDAAITYTITGPVIVEDGATLTIPAGTLIKANKAFSSYILVLQGGKININGTAEKPVKMTSVSDHPAAGDWGGLIINGRAPIAGYNGTKGTLGKTEISTAYPYGGDKADDNSGVITYLILEGTGAKTSSDVEHNGLTLNGVGNGTKIENVFVVEGADDGIEFYGGSVNVTNLLVVDSDDDMFDFTQGYTGELKNAYGMWRKGFTSSEEDPRGIEGDGNLDGDFPAHTGQSDCRLTNITIDLRLDYVTTGAADFKTKALQDAVKIRRGAKAVISNIYVMGTGHVQDLVDLTDGKGGAAEGTTVQMVYNLTAPEGATNPDRIANPATGYQLDITRGTTGGCDPVIFGWVADAGYNIF